MVEFVDFTGRPDQVMVALPPNIVEYSAWQCVSKLLRVNSYVVFFLPTVASPIGNFLPRNLELGTGTPYNETESLVDFSRLGKSPIRSKMVIYGSLPVKLPVKISFPEIFIEPKVAY